MVVLVGNLPKPAAEKDLCQLLGIPVGTRIRIVKKTSRSGDIQRFALVPTKSQQQARKLITRVRRTDWLGHTLGAHEYQSRTAANERRRVDWRSISWPADERRADERRSAGVAK